MNGTVIGHWLFTQRFFRGWSKIQKARNTARPFSTRTVLVQCLVVFLLQGCSDLDTQKMRHLERGKTHFEQARYEKARVEFKNVVQLAPEDADAHFWLAHAQERLGNWRNALLEYERTIKLDPKHVLAKVKLGTLYLADKRMDEALSLVEKAHKLEPDNLEATLLQAKAHARMGNSQLALQYAEKAHNGNPQSVETALLLATLYIQNNHPDKAKEITNFILAENPSNLRC